jgi:hypothetical protein
MDWEYLCNLFSLEKSFRVHYSKYPGRRDPLIIPATPHEEELRVQLRTNVSVIQSLFEEELTQFMRHTASDLAARDVVGMMCG